MYADSTRAWEILKERNGRILNNKSSLPIVFFNNEEGRPQILPEHNIIDPA
jgi:hypothetical protein